MPVLGFTLLWPLGISNHSSALSWTLELEYPGAFIFSLFDAAVLMGCLPGSFPSGLPAEWNCPCLPPIPQHVRGVPLTRQIVGVPCCQVTLLRRSAQGNILCPCRSYRVVYFMRSLWSARIEAPIESGPIQLTL